jgi:hypothetical protein
MPAPDEHAPPDAIPDPSGPTIPVPDEPLSSPGAPPGFPDIPHPRPPDVPFPTHPDPPATPFPGHPEPPAEPRA